ncbi:MAG: hypothetical protein OXG44_14700 [Gammaproteobacteria bacterium]|nr:hypothetical protein [Gammaproteobacteria bacterium]MDE0190536.1 hypothetical protein [Gammaproteobacteria bacterium]
MQRNGFRHALAGVVLAALIASTARAEDGIYVGITVVGALYDATYDKTVDNTLAHNASMLFAGQRLHAEDSADSMTYEGGVLVGYRGSLGVLFYGIEADWMTHQGTVSGHLEGVGTTPQRNQVGENWPEDWELAKDKSYGVTVRVGGEVPLIDTTGYVLVGIRRVQTDFSRSYFGCLLADTLCEPAQFQTGSEFFDENFNAWSFGAGVEQPLANLVVRAELRYVAHGSADQLVLFDDLGVSVPTRLEASEIGLGVSLLWTF